MRCQTGSLFLSLADFLLRGVLENESVQLVPHIHGRAVAAGLALERDEVLSDLDDSLGVAAAVALNVLLDEAFKQLLELACVVRAVHNGRARGLVIFGEGAELAAEVLYDVCSCRNTHDQ